MRTQESSRKRKSLTSDELKNKKQRMRPNKPQKSTTQGTEVKIRSRNNTTNENNRSTTEDFTKLRDSEDDGDDNGHEISSSHMAELLKGFDSSSEEEGFEQGVSLATQPGEESGITTNTIPPIPVEAKAPSKTTAISKPHDHDEPVVLYIGRIPHGFYEHQMRAYFSQFGEIAHLRLAHNRRTGAVKHYGFIQFVSGEVGRIVQKTMDKYLLFGHILQVQEVPQQRLKELKQRDIDIWKDEGRRFHTIPWRGIQRGRLKSASREEWDSRIQREQKRREEKALQLGKLGYHFDMPEIRNVDSVPVKRKDEPTDASLSS